MAEALTKTKEVKVSLAEIKHMVIWPTDPWSKTVKTYGDFFNRYPFITNINWISSEKEKRDRYHSFLEYFYDDEACFKDKACVVRTCTAERLRYYHPQMIPVSINVLFTIYFLHHDCSLYLRFSCKDSPCVLDFLKFLFFSLLLTFFNRSFCLRFFRLCF